MKGVTKPQVITFWLSVSVVACGALVLILSNSLLKDWIIIGYGVRALGSVRTVGIGIIVVGAILVVVRSVPIIRTLRHHKEQQQRAVTSARDKTRVLNDYAQDSENPEFTRKRLAQLREETPGFERLVLKCLMQMDDMDTIQDKQNALIEANDARYLKDTVAVLDNVERRLCRNFRSVINLCIAAGSVDYLDNEKVERKLEDNQKKLDDAKELLKASVDWINQYDNDAGSDRSELENWIAVIRDSLKEE